jgi:glycosyltransferase involved in cell wall biosynthesis
MPKTGLLGMLAAFLIGIPIRIHTFHGEVWATRSGWRRKLLKLFDKFVAFLATDILLVSPSQRDFLFREGVLSLNQGKVIGSGSVCGVDHLRFHPDKNIRIDFRTSLGIKNCSTVILFLGRLNKDKGLLDLARAFHSISQSHTDAVLLIVGTEEDLPFIRIQEICSTTCDRLFYLPFTSKPECYMAAADIFCLPSYREGFGMTIIEAASCGIPTVGSRIYGITDAVADGKTGLLFPAGDVLALTNTLLILIDDNELRRQMGNDARVRAIELFSSDRITGEMLLLYDNLLKDADAQ